MKPMMTILVALALAGCASPPSADEARHADYGVYPSAYRAAVKDYYARVMKDPDSMVYKSWGEPAPFSYYSSFDKTRHGFMVCVTYNAKNSYGGYTGFKTDAFFLRDGSIQDVIEGGVRFGKPVC